MPTVRVEYNPNSENAEEAVYDFYEQLPSIVAPLMNISGRDLHDGGVGESEIIVDLIEYSGNALNINDIQITVIAHAYEERKQRLDGITEAIRDAVKEILHGPDYFDEYLDLKVAVSVWLVEMGYATT